MKRMYSDGSQDLDFTSQPWAHTIDLINNSIGLRAVGSADIIWSDGTTKFFYAKGGSGANRFQGGIRVQPYVATGLWQEIKKTDFGAGTFPAAGSPTELIIDLGTDDTVQIPDDAYIITNKKRTGEATLAMINHESGEVVHKIDYATHLNMNVIFDAQDFINQIKDWYRQKGWVENDGESETIVIPSQYVHVTTDKVTVEEEALPPEVRINYTSTPINYIYVLPKTIVMPN